MVEEEKRSRLVGVRLCCWILFLTIFSLWELGHRARITSSSSTLRGELGASILWFVCVAPLQLGGLMGKKSTPNIGWEVPVRTQRLVRRSWTKHECGTTTSKPSPLLKVHLSKFSNCN
jgi:hypothetical protein